MVAAAMGLQMRRAFAFTSCALVCLGPLLGCGETRAPGFEPFSSGMGGADTGTSSSSDSESGASGLKLDLAAEPDSLAVECASISQTTMIVDRPSDIIIVADDDVDRHLIQANVTNIIPSMETEGVFDSRVTLIASGDPPPGAPEDDFPCEVWDCEDTKFKYFNAIDAPVATDGVLRAVLANQGGWMPHMRDNAWKHVFVTSMSGGDAAITNPEFLTEFSSIIGGAVATTVHAFVIPADVDDPEGFQGAAEATDGVYQSGDLLFDEFERAVIERIKATALACDYEIPEPPDGLLFDRDHVNVIYDDGTDVRTIGHVETADDCQTFGLGWYYDDPADPTKIRMCPLSCAGFADTGNATIDIQFGCETIQQG